MQSGDDLLQLLEGKNLLHADNLGFLQTLLIFVEDYSLLGDAEKQFLTSVQNDVNEYVKIRETQPITFFRKTVVKRKYTPAYPTPLSKKAI